LVVHAWLSAGPDGSLMGSWSAVGLDKSLTLLARLFCFVLSLGLVFSLGHETANSFLTGLADIQLLNFLPYQW